MTKEERHQRNIYLLDETSILIAILFFGIMGALFHTWRKTHRVTFNPFLIGQSIVIAVGGYSAIHSRFKFNEKGKPPYWKRLYAGLNAAFGGLWVSENTQG